MYGLLFHSVDVKPKMNMSSYPSGRFAATLDELVRRDITAITVSQYQSSYIPSEKKLTTAITFDDGLRNFYICAYPLLEERGIKATVFAVAGLVGKDGGWDVMGQTSHMDKLTLREIADSGHEVGSHSLTHANLIWLDDDELMKELRDSKAMLEDITGKEVVSLSFPFGSWNARVWDAAKSVGYKYATAYRGHRLARAHSAQEIMPVLGAYRFDSASDIITRIYPKMSLSKIRALMMSHFSKGTPIVKFRREYRRFPW